jgi:hypothetical protein
MLIKPGEILLAETPLQDAREESRSEGTIGTSLPSLTRQLRGHREILAKVSRARQAVKCSWDDVIGEPRLADVAAGVPRVDDGDGVSSGMPSRSVSWPPSLVARKMVWQIMLWTSFKA